MDNMLQKETFEWSNIWCDHANDASLPRVLLIGDSISVGYSPVVTDLLQGKVFVDRLGTSRSINDPVLAKETMIRLDEFRYRIIHFNNGLHGWHLPDPVYATALCEYTELLQRLGQGAKLVWASSTPVTVTNKPDTIDEEKNPQLLRRNARAAEIMGARGIPVDDLYQTVLGKADLRSPDGYHYNGEGQKVLGKAVAEAIAKAMG